MKNIKIKQLRVLFVAFTCLLLFPVLSFSQVVQLAWEPSTSAEVAGYKIYYKAASGELPLDGIEALEGPSPIDVGNTTSFTLSELPEGAVYYFCASAYDNAGNESDLSNMVSSNWVPATLAPAMDETVGSSAVLVWSAPPEEQSFNFSLLLGTDPELRTDIKINKGLLKKYPTLMQTLVIDGLTDTSYTTSELLSGATYYWQIVATDDSGQQYASIISSFVAE